MFDSLKKATDNYIASNSKAFSRINPTALTLLGIIPSLLFFILIIHGHYALALIALAANAIDGIDGAIARATNRVTAFGGVLDSTIDRIADFFIITSFGFAGLAGWPIILSVLLTSFLVSYIRSRGELAGNGKLKMNIGLIERQERLAFIFVVVLAYIFFPIVMLFFNIIEVGFFILAILSLYTFFQRVLFAYKNLE